MSTTARKAWLKLLRIAGVKKFRATSGLGLPFICYLDDESGETLFYNPNCSVSELALMSAWCSTIDRPVIFDIGANNGFIATQLAQLLRKNNPCIYAFEPVPSTFAHLKSSIESLGLDKTVFPVCSAMSDSIGEAKLFYNPHQSLFAQVRDDKLNPRAGGRSVLAPSTTVGEIVNSLQIRPHLMKVDVEGYEPHVLQGAADLLKSNDPPAICFELNPLTLSEINSSVSDLTRLLSNYRSYYIDDFEGQRRAFGEEISDLAEISWVCNIFAIPRGLNDKWNPTRSGAISTMAKL
jgi:FkbM family methyltransferase